MKRIKNKIALLILLLVPLLAVGSPDASQANEESGQINTKEIIFGHVGDAYDWHLFTIGHRHVSIPLPIIVKSAERGWFVFSSSRLSHGESYKGFFISQSEQSYPGKVVETNGGGVVVRPLDVSLTKNALSIVIVCVLMISVFGLMARGYRQHPLQSRRGAAGMMEVLVIFIYDDLIKPSVGKDYKKFAPYLLTAFFFIFFTNLLGLLPIFPGGANVTGNIAVTLTLALITFVITNVYGTKEYWKEVFWPEVPLWLKLPVPLMPVIELIGVFTKPFALMMRLFANMLAGHMIVLVLISLIFIFTALLGVVVGSGVAVVSILFSIFMTLIHVLVCFIQAYVFTMLSAIFIGMSRVEPHSRSHSETTLSEAIEK